jgi:glutamyl-tRNA reductase
MAELTAKYLAEANIASLVIANRTIARANELARLYKGQGIALSQLSTNLTEMDIIIASTASNNFIITFDMIKSSMELRRGRPILLIDISVPRNIDPKIRNIDNVFLFDIDDLKQVVESHKKNREQEIERVQVIIEDELRDFLSWYNALGTGTLIKDLHNKSDKLREVELARWTSKLNQLEPHEKDLIERILKAYANKLLHDPLVQIRKFANEEDGLIRLDTVRKLFNVEKPTPPRDS